MRQLLGKIPYQQHARRHRPFGKGSDPLEIAYPSIRLWTPNMGLTVGDASDARLTFDNVSSFDSKFFSTVSSGGRIYSVHYKIEGWYATFVQFAWTSSFATGQVGIQMQYTGDTIGGAAQGSPNGNIGFHVGPYPALSITRYFPDEFDSLPGAPEIWVAQDSGSSRGIDQAVWQSCYLGAADYPT